MVLISFHSTSIRRSGALSAITEYHIGGIESLFSMCNKYKNVYTCFSGCNDGENEKERNKQNELIAKVINEYIKKYPEVKCAYLYGSYARGEATGKSDVDILVVCHGMGLSFYGMAGELKDALHKEVDLQTHAQIVDSESMIEDILTEGIKIYG